MILRLARLLKKPGNRSPARHPSLQDMQSARTAMLHAVHDCEGLPALRLRQKLETTHSAQELWMLRNDAFQLICRRHTQSVATERINALVPHFEGLLDARQLARVR